VKVSYNDDELKIISAAAERDSAALASWVGSAALAVAKETVVPASADAKSVVQELIRSRAQLSRVGNDLGQIARALSSDGTVPGAQLSTLLSVVETAIRRSDAATLQLMRERPPRS
jgi:hypothetical protein